MRELPPLGKDTVVRLSRQGGFAPLHALSKPREIEFGQYDSAQRGRICSVLERCLPVAGTRTRCGWLANLTPNDMWLVDKEATWVITSQAGAQSAAGLDRLPDFDRRQFLRTAGDYGYGCACMKVLTGPEQTISVIFSARIQAIAICKADGSLPPLSRW